jgi:hypothetical protein
MAMSPAHKIATMETQPWKRRLLNWALNNRTGLMLIILAALFVAGWRITVIAGRPWRLQWQTIANELGSIPDFRQDLLPNSLGNRLVYCRTTEKGVGLYFLDIDDCKSKLLCEQREKGYSWQRYCMLGWSPKDRLFAYTVPLETHSSSQPWLREQQIVICDGLTGETAAKVSADPDVYQLAWLTPDSFAYSTAYNHDLRLVEKNEAGKWALRHFYEKVSTNRMETLTALSAKSVAWLDGENIETFDFDSGRVKRIWDSNQASGQLVDFTFAKDRGEFILNCSDARGQFLIRFSPDTGMMTDGGRIGIPRDFVGLIKNIKTQPPDWVAAWKRQGQIVLNVNWPPRGPGYACTEHLNRIGEWPALCVKTRTDQPLLPVPWNGFVENFATGGNRLFFTGSENGAVPGIWEYDTETEMTRCLVAGTTRRLPHIQPATSITGTVTNRSGEAKTYYLWPPAGHSEGRKHPLIVTKQFWNWFPYNQIAANEGFFFAVVDESCVEELPVMLAKRFNVDSKLVYLYESSDGTDFASQLIEQKPDLWKGAIFFGPGRVPALSALHDKRLLLVAGTDDADIVKSMTRYQMLAARAGYAITLAFLNDSGHMPNSMETERKRAELFGRFLTED